MTTYRGITEDLSLILDTKVRLRSTTSMLGFESALKSRTYDIAFIDGGQFISTALKAGYLPLVTREGELTFKLYTLDDSPIKHYSDLKGKSLGVMIEGTTTFYVTDKLLKQHHLTFQDVNIVPLDTQQVCAHSLVVGKVDACVFVASILSIIEQQNIATKFRPIGHGVNTVKPIFAVHRSIRPEIRAKIKSYLLGRGAFIEAGKSYIEEIKANLLLE